MNIDNFELVSVALRGDGGVTVEWNFKPEAGQVMDDASRDSHVVAHPDLKVPFETFKKVVYNFVGFNSICSEAGKLGKTAQNWAINKSEELEDLVSCHKIKLMGKDNKRLIICTGKLKNGNSSAAINAPRASTSAAWGVDCDEAISNLEDEVFAYLFDGKAAQLDLNQAMNNGDGKGNEAPPEE